MGDIYPDDVCLISTKSRTSKIKKGFVDELVRARARDNFWCLVVVESAKCGLRFSCPAWTRGFTARNKIDLSLSSSSASQELLRGISLLSGNSIDRTAIMSSKPQSVNGSESEFEFIETPKAPTPTFEKFEDCGVRTTSVS